MRSSRWLLHRPVQKLVDTFILVLRCKTRMQANPSVSTTSSRTSYRSRRLFKKSVLIHSVAPPFQIEPAALGFDLVLGADLKPATSILLRCYKNPECASVRDFTILICFQNIFINRQLGLDPKPGFNVILPLLN